MLVGDHSVCATKNLEKVQTKLKAFPGLKFEKVGRHEKFGTHNSLLRLEEIHFELIVVDPFAIHPKEVRWFDLDNFWVSIPLIAWVGSICDMQKALSKMPFYGGYMLACHVTVLNTI